jgi:cell division protein ZapE
MPHHLHTIYDTRVAEGILRPDSAQRDALLQLELIRDHLETPQPRGFLARFRRPTPPDQQGLYLWGGVGRGKSMVMDLFYAHTNITEKRRVHFHAFMQEVQSALHDARKTGVDDAIAPVAANIAKDVRLLCFDEMQITDIADAMIVGRLFEILFQAGVQIVTTSNRPPRDLYKDGLNRALFLPFIDLMQTRLQVYELAAATDYRQDRLAGAQVYFTPTGDGARKAIDLIWRDMTGGQEDPMVLKIKGRTLRLPRYWAGMARSDFAALCTTALGPADYLALVGAIRVLILEDVPVLTRDRANEAKRFVTLIDTLYEAKTRLILSADADPEHLYTQGPGAFEFERTASRLREMQSADWGQ